MKWLSLFEQAPEDDRKAGNRPDPVREATEKFTLGNVTYTRNFDCLAVWYQLRPDTVHDSSIGPVMVRGIVPDSHVLVVEMLDELLRPTGEPMQMPAENDAQLRDEYGFCELTEEAKAAYRVRFYEAHGLDAQGNQFVDSEGISFGEVEESVPSESTAVQAKVPEKEVEAELPKYPHTGREVLEAFHTDRRMLQGMQWPGSKDAIAGHVFDDGLVALTRGEFNPAQPFMIVDEGIKGGAKVYEVPFPKSGRNYTYDQLLQLIGDKKVRVILDGVKGLLYLKPEPEKKDGKEMTGGSKGFPSTIVNPDE